MFKDSIRFFEQNKNKIRKMTLGLDGKRLMLNFMLSLDDGVQSFLKTCLSPSTTCLRDVGPENYRITSILKRIDDGELLAGRHVNKLLSKAISEWSPSSSPGGPSSLAASGASSAREQDLWLRTRIRRSRSQVKETPTQVFQKAGESATRTTGPHFRRICRIFLRSMGSSYASNTTSRASA